VVISKNVNAGRTLVLRLQYRKTPESKIEFDYDSGGKKAQ
jgi:hypothetical protein